MLPFLRLLTMVSMMMAWLLLECAFSCVNAVVLHQFRCQQHITGLLFQTCVILACSKFSCKSKLIHMLYCLALGR